MTDASEVRAHNVYGDPVENLHIGPMDEHRKVELSAPGYEPRHMRLDFNDTKPDDVLMWIDAKTAVAYSVSPLSKDLTGCALINFNDALDVVWLRGQAVSDFLDYPPRRREQDRIYVPCLSSLRDALKESPQFRHAPSSLHSSPEPDAGWYVMRSHKLKGRTPVLQMTMWKKAQTADEMEAMKSAEWVAEIDLDLGSGIKHLGEVIHNAVTGELTHPHDVAQALALGWGIWPYEVVPGTGEAS